MCHLLTVHCVLFRGLQVTWHQILLLCTTFIVTGELQFECHLLKEFIEHPSKKELDPLLKPYLKQVAL